MLTVLITGGTGMIGQTLGQALLEKGYQVIILSRKKNVPAKRNLTYVQWDVDKKWIEKDAIASADYIIHLAGEGIADKRWTAKRKREIADSRVKGGELIAVTLASVPNKVRAVIGASAIGWYGPDPVIPNPAPFEESAHADDSFLGNTCKQWEQSLQPVRQLGKRLVYIRTGIVLSKTGGALPEFEKPLRFGIAAILGSGKQVISWIHINDLVSIYIKAIEDESMTGPQNAVAPFPVSNKTFTLTLAAIKRKKAFIAVYVPAFLLKLALGEVSIEVLKSTTVSATRVQLAGYEFRYPVLLEALKDLA